MSNTTNRVHSRCAKAAAKAGVSLNAVADRTRAEIARHLQRYLGSRALLPGLHDVHQSLVRGAGQRDWNFDLAGPH